MALMVKCRKCSASVAATGEDTPGVASDGTPVLTASCGGCGARTAYRRPRADAPATPADGPPADPDSAGRPASPAPRPQVVRLPAVVLEAAWWVKFTLSTLWYLVLGASALWLIGVALFLRR